MNKYHSTRNKQIEASSSEAILKGIAQDGGLFVRDEFPFLNIDALESMSFQELSKQVLSSLLEDYQEEEINQYVEEAYGEQWEDKAITPLVNIGQEYILELFHGPTAAFKDVALQMLPHLLKGAILKQKQKEDVLILTATSGDTGKAALAGFKDIEHTNIMVFYPSVGISQIQRLQMMSQTGNNVSVCAIEGNFDDAQNQVKQIFTNPKFKEVVKAHHLSLSSANSINIGRLMPQIVYYFDAYRQLLKSNKIKKGEEICFSVPTGNFGDILAGYYAKKMGLPIHRLICSVNRNNVLYDFFQTGSYDRNRDFHPSLSPSMDILISSNLERLLYDVSDQNTMEIASYMEALKTTGRFTITKTMKAKLDQIIFASTSDDEQTKKDIHDVYQQYHYVMDPHTAVAYHGTQLYRQGDAQHKIVTLSTASPYKFAESVKDALALDLDIKGDAMSYLSKATNTSIPVNLKDLDKKAILHHDCIKKEDMQNYVFGKLKGVHHD
ncbi:MAG: threonine synthase [Erysipelotrichaceae bacterium]